MWKYCIQLMQELLYEVWLLYQIVFRRKFLTWDIFSVLWVWGYHGFQWRRRTSPDLLVQMLCIFVYCLRIMEYVPQDFCHLDWVDFCRLHLSMSLIVLCHHVVGGDVAGLVCLNILENRRQQPERGFLVALFTVLVITLRAFPTCL